MVIRVEESQSGFVATLKNFLIVEKVCKCFSEIFCELNVEVHVVVELIILHHTYSNISI